MTSRVRVFSEFNRVGRRGAVLLAMGLLFVFLGIGYVRYPGPLALNSERSLHLALVVPGMTLREWGFIFILVGAFACLCAHWPPGKDGWGFLALQGLAIFWACVYFSGQIFFDAYRAWTVGCLFVDLSVIIYIVAGWAEPRRS